MKIFYSPLVQEHDPKFYFQMGNFDEYPEKAARAESVLKAVKVRDWESELVSNIDDYGIEPILAVHSREYCEYLQSAYKTWMENGGNKNGVIPDTFPHSRTEVLRDIIPSRSMFFKSGYYAFDTAAVVAEMTYKAAYQAVQVTLTATDDLIKNKRDAVFALVRPPGHHAAGELMGGFCFFNNIAVAAQYLIDHYQSKVCILDVDYHHGNGTQAIFYERANPKFISLHGEGDYPFYWGYKTETGEGEGKGFNVNIPIPAGVEDEEYFATLDHAIKNHIIPYNPTVLLVSLGVDTAKADPVGKFALSDQAFPRIGALIKQVGVPTLFVFEGGYAVDELGDNVCNVLAGFEEI